MTKTIIFTGLQVLDNQVWKKDQAVVVEAGKIKAIIQQNRVPHHLPAEIYTFSAEHYLAPGLIDMHVHGANGHDVMDASQEALTAMSAALAQEGVTGFLATTMSASAAKLNAVLTSVADYIADHATGVQADQAARVEGAAILGVHMEGPFIASDKLGAQAMSLAIDGGLVKKWQSTAQGAIKVMTFAPELPDALALIKVLHEQQIIASIGHTHATFEQTCAAIAAGCTQATHLFNAMSGLHQRAPGAVGALLLAETVTAEVIADAHHLHPAIVELILRLKGKERLLLVSDSMRAKCLGDGDYDLGGQTVYVKEGKATLSDGTLAGSVLRLPDAIKNIVQFSHCSFADAILMASMNPARILGLASRKGSIAVGKDADLVVFNPTFDVALTMRAGEVIFAAQ